MADDKQQTIAINYEETKRLYKNIAVVSYDGDILYIFFLFEEVLVVERVC